jgi:anti-anti-sigma factor
LLYAVYDRRWRFAHHLKRPATGGRLRFIPISGAAEPYLKIETEERDGAYVVRLSGDVDLETVTLLQGALDGRIRNSRNVILDCEHLTYMDSTGFNLLSDLYRRGRQLILVAPTPTVLKVLRVFGLDTLIPVTPSVEEALRVLLEHEARPASPGESPNRGG